MNYFISHKTKEGYVYSCDKICIVGKVNYSFLTSFGLDISNYFFEHCIRDMVDSNNFPWSYTYLADYVFYNKFGVGEYRNNVTLKLSNRSSFWFGFCHNSDKGNKISWKIELNPNKCMPCDFVSGFIEFLHMHSDVSSVMITQFDLAIDFLMERSAFYLNKDRRISTIINDGFNNTTEYLSKHNSHGFVKLYNKSAESKLDYHLTRLEITLKKFCIIDVVSVFPSVHIFDKSQITFNDELSDLSDNDSVFVDLLRLHPEYFDKLTYRKRQKFAPYMSYNAPLYELDIFVYNKLYADIKEVFLNV